MMVAMWVMNDVDEMLEWDGECTRCHVPMVWHDVAGQWRPDSEEDAICHDCACRELVAAREVVRLAAASECCIAYTDGHGGILRRSTGIVAALKAYDASKVARP